jgi:hypothetical protein
MSLTTQNGADVLAVFATAGASEGLAEKNVIVFVWIERIDCAIKFVAGLLDFPIAESEVLRCDFFDLFERGFFSL